MVTIVETIPRKKANMIRVPKEKPRIMGTPGNEKIEFENLVVPYGLNRVLLQKAKVAVRAEESGLRSHHVATRIKAKNSNQDLFIRYAGNKPLSIVTETFQEIDPVDVAEKASEILGVKPITRYFANDESLQFNFPIETRFSGLNLVISTGKYGTYGGSGQHAMKYGISWYNKTCSNWTMFLNKTLHKGLGKIYHKGEKSIESELDRIMNVAGELEGKITDSKYQLFSGEELNSYMVMYAQRGLNKKIADKVLEENPNGTSAYDLSYRLTELCQNDKLSDVSRARIEYIAGEVILCFDDIKKKMTKPQETMRQKRVIRGPRLPLQYVDLN